MMPDLSLWLLIRLSHQTVLLRRNTVSQNVVFEENMPKNSWRKSLHGLKMWPKSLTGECAPDWKGEGGEKSHYSAVSEAAIQLKALEEAQDLNVPTTKLKDKQMMQ